ncbi:MAG: hypothetical protein HYU63_05580 [Armatimonadetes bacterium]|nr:hypothetical protein [Armatimonadota bacterium]
MKKNILLIPLFLLLILSFIKNVSAQELTVNYKDTYYTFKLDDDIKHLSLKIKSSYPVVDYLDLGVNVEKFWAAATPKGAVVVWKVSPNSFPYRLIELRSGKISASDYLYVDKYDVKYLSIQAKNYGAIITVYYETGGEKSFILKFPGFHKEN